MTSDASNPTQTELSTPAFGQADLSNCEREQIHFAGSIQPHGALLVVREPDYVIIQASANAASFLRQGNVLNVPLREIDGDLWERISPNLVEPLETVPLAIRCNLGTPRTAFDCLLHRPPEGGLLIELEPAGPRVDLALHVEKALGVILATATLRAHCDETARIFKDLTGYDRVMVYRFDDQGHGEVFSERKNPDLEAFLGNRYPASDIPQIARRLYERNRVRVLVDMDYEPVPLTPRLSPITGQELDMSLCFLRSSSPIHVQYLKNMGVAATLVVSLMVGGRLWGLIACHHYVPKFVHFEVRAVCEILAEAVATRITALESFAQAQAELSVRRLEQRMIEAISRDGDWKVALFDSSQSLLQPIGAAGAALLFEGQVLTTGDVPGTLQLREIAAWLDRKERSPLFATVSLRSDDARFSPLTPVASGVLAAPVSNTPGEYLIWFRPERIRTVTWGGDPEKPFLIGNNPLDLSPRRSFAQWHQLVEGTSEPWSPGDLTAARLIGDTVSDVIIQFQSVRSLIAQDQLDHVTRQVRISESPVVTADTHGRILLANDSFLRLLPATHQKMDWLENLAPYFIDQKAMSEGLEQLTRFHRPWRSEVKLLGKSGEAVALLVRADPVMASPDRVLGFVLFFTDLTERKSAEVARRRFQERVIERRHSMNALRFETSADLVYRNLLSPVVENAQVAALEITDSEDVANMRQLLESVRASVTRTAEVLEYLVWHATHEAGDSDAAPASRHKTRAPSFSPPALRRRRPTSTAPVPERPPKQKH